MMTDKRLPVVYDGKPAASGAVTFADAKRLAERFCGKGERAYVFNREDHWEIVVLND